MLRRLIGPIKLWHDERQPAYIPKRGKKGGKGQGHIGEDDVVWKADVKAEALAEGLVHLAGCARDEEDEADGTEQDQEGIS